MWSVKTMNSRPGAPGAISMLLLLALQVASAQTIQFDFCELEGFESGDINNHPRWVSYAKANVVDAAGSGHVQLSPEAEWVNSICAIGVASKDALLKASARLSFSEGFASGRGDLFSLVAMESPHIDVPALRVALRRVDDRYLLFFKSSAGNPVFSRAVDRSELGFGGELHRSGDELGLTMGLLRGSKPEIWVVETVLSNLTRSVELLSLSLTNVATTAEFHDAPACYFGFSSSMREKSHGAENRQVGYFEVARSGAEDPALPAANGTAATPRFGFSPLYGAGRGSDGWTAGKKVALLDIPHTVNELRDKQQGLQAELAMLPMLNDTLQFEAYGYHSGYFPVLRELPANPRWTLDFTFNPNISLSKIILVPAVDHRYGQLSSYGFPERFRVLTVSADGSAHVAQEWMDADCPDPGRYPVIIDVPHAGDCKVRIEVFRGCEDGGREMFALDELFGVMGMADHPCIEVKASSEFESPPYWGKRFLIDRKTSLGLPLDVRFDIGANGSDKDFVVTFDAPPPSNSCVVELDLGENRKMGWITLFPAQSSQGIMTPGFGFPATLALEMVVDAGDGERGVTRRVPWDWRTLRPGNNIVRLPGADMSGRWMRIHVDDLPLRNGKPTFAMGEFHVFRQETTYPIRAIRLEGFPEEAASRIHLLMDGKSGGHPIMFPMDWLHLIERRNHLTHSLTEVTEAENLLQQQWNRFWRISISSTVLLLALAAVAIAVTVTLQRQKSLRELKWRIARDLHDEVGSSLGSISLTAERLEADLQDAGMRSDLFELGLLAREASASLRDVVWVIDQSEIRLPVLVQKLIDRAERTLRGMELTVEVPSDIPDHVVPLSCKRHLIMFFKEVIHNCARHSGATKVSIAISTGNNHLQLSIRDNGCGFDPGQARDGWGLDSLRKRAEELGGTVRIHTAPGEGTAIELAIPQSTLFTRNDHYYKTSN